VGSGGDAYQLTSIDNTGKIEGSVGQPALYENPRLSSDGKRFAVFRPEGGGDIWITDLERGTNTRLTLDPGIDNEPLWSPDGSRIAFVSNRDGGIFNIYQKSSGFTGEDELLLKTPTTKLSTIGRLMADTSFTRRQIQRRIGISGFCRLSEIESLFGCWRLRSTKPARLFPPISAGSPTRPMRVAVPRFMSRVSFFREKVAGFNNRWSA
jgi:hypothetical protein